MRLLAIALFTLMAAALIVFALNNVGTLVPVTFVRTYPEVSLWVVVAIAYALGAIGVGIAAVMEGADTRLANRRLRRELHKLEIEVNYLRTQPARGEPSMAASGAAPATSQAQASATRSAREGKAFPTAPVYDEGEDSTDLEDETYSGGRAV